MSVIRIHKTKNFTVMSNHHFKERGLSLKAKGLLSLMLSLPDDWNYSIAGLVKLSKDGKDSVMTALAELEKFGYLTRTQMTNDKGQFSGIEYNIFEEPQPKTTIAEKPNTENENTEKQNAEKPPQLNTNSIKNLKNKDIKELSTKEDGEADALPDEIFEILSNVVEDDELRDLFMDYAVMRNECGTPLTPKGLQMLITRTERLAEYSTDVAKAIVETAIINNWQNVYAPKPEELIGRNSMLEERKRMYLGD